LGLLDLRLKLLGLLLERWISCLSCWTCCWTCVSRCWSGVHSAVGAVGVAGLAAGAAGVATGSAVCGSCGSCGKCGCNCWSYSWICCWKVCHIVLSRYQMPLPHDVSCLARSSASSTTVGFWRTPVLESRSPVDGG